MKTINHVNTPHNKTYHQQQKNDISHRWIQVESYIKSIQWNGLAFIGWVCSIAIIFILFFLVIHITINGWNKLSIEFLFSSPTNGMKNGGIFPIIFGTVALVFLMILFVVPMGVFTAIYLHEYAPKNFLTQLIRLSITNLAGLPSIVFGLFGLGFFIGFVGHGLDQAFFDGETTLAQPGILWASLTMALLTLPVVIVSTEESLSAVSKDIKQASYALGATQAQTIFKLVLPNSISGILTGTILAIGRGAGEVAPILFIGVVYYMPNLPLHLNDQFMHLGYHIFILSTHSPNLEEMKPILYSSALVLLILTVSLNGLAVFIQNRIAKKQKINSKIRITRI